MSLRFFSDQCVPASISEGLQSVGHDVVRLREHLPPNAVDPAVIAKAQELQRILVSLNGDFADIVTYPPSKFGGIIAIQLHNHPEIIPDLLERLAHFLRQNLSPEYYRGKLLIVEAHRIRIRQ